MFRYEQQIMSVLPGIKVNANPEVLTYCPFHDNKNTPAFHINLDTGMWVCFVCTRKKKDGTEVPLGGNIKILFSRLGKKMFEVEEDVDVLLSRIELLQSNSSFYSSDEGSSSSSNSSKSAHAGARAHARAREQAEAYASLDSGQWVTLRGIDPYIKSKYILGYHPQKHALTIPAFSNDGDVEGIIFRYLDRGPREIKYEYPKGWKKSKRLWGSHLCEGGSPLVLVEGTIDVLWVKQTMTEAAIRVDVVPQLGSSLSAAQATMILDLDPSKILLMLDNDDSGIKASFVAHNLLHRYVNVEAFDWRTVSGNDPAEVPSPELWDTVGRWAEGPRTHPKRLKPVPPG